MIADERLYQIALHQISGIGPILYRRLIHHCGSASQVFREKKSVLEQIPGIGAVTASLLKNRSAVLKRAEQELEFVQGHAIQILFLNDTGYPERLRHCYDAPPLLYYKGNADLNHKRIISIVGTRMPSAEGAILCAQLVEALAIYDVLVISGLAFGVDTLAHQTALKVGLPTIGVLAHGLDKLYPGANRSLAKKMLCNGGLLSDYASGTIPDKENFPMRNRIVAGLADATLVVESGLKGGSLITAEYANNYNRDVFALPGRVTDERSAGCLQLIRTHKAGLISSAAEIAMAMNWENGVQLSIQNQGAAGDLKLDPEEERIIMLMKGRAQQHMEEIAGQLQTSSSALTSALMNLEFSGLVKSLPGGYYRLNGIMAQAALG